LRCSGILVVAIYVVISTIINAGFKKIYKVFTLVCIFIGLAFMILFIVLNNDIAMGFGITTGVALSDFINAKKEKYTN